MKLYKLCTVTTLLSLLTACNDSNPPMPVLATDVNNTPTPILNIPSSTPAVFSSADISADMFLYNQDFEAGSSLSELNGVNNWKIETDEDENHILCSNIQDYYPNIFFGYPEWDNYVTELKVKTLEPHSDLEENYVTLLARVDNELGMNYYGAMGFYQNDISGLAYNAPYEGLGNLNKKGNSDIWYTLRLEVAGDRISFYIDNELVSKAVHTKWRKGISGFSASPNMKVCIDDIRVWQLDIDGKGILAKNPLALFKPNLEIVTVDAATGKDGSNWGGHQSQIVRTKDGVFTTFTIDGTDPLHRRWQLAKRQNNMTWLVIAENDSGREPVNLLASPEGKLYIIGWPNEIGTLWSGKPDGNTIELEKELIPGAVVSNYPYGAAGINLNGDLCILSSQGGQKPGGSFKWSCYLAESNEWFYKTTYIDYKFAYSYIIPGKDEELSIVSSRDVRWSALGYKQPEGSFDYVFNAIGYWRTNGIKANPLERLFLTEEQPTDQFQYVNLKAQEDAYIDTSGNIHILYHKMGESTNGEDLNRHAIISPDGILLNDVNLPNDTGYYTRIFQDIAGNFFLLGSSGILYPAGKDGITIGNPVYIDLQGYVVDYSGFVISAPRTGTPLSNIIDVVFPSGGGKQRVYFELKLPVP